jgi:hypothetical protein
MEDGRVLAAGPIPSAPPVHVAPAFTDAHCHLLWTGSKLVRPDLSACGGGGRLLEAVGAAAEAGEGILRAEGWDESEWTDPTLPTLAEMDSAAAGRPVFATRACGHAALVNSAMLSMLTERFPGLTPAGAVVTEEPVLRFQETFPPSRTELRAALAAASELAGSCGVTGMSSVEGPAGAGFLLEEPPEHLRISVYVHAEDPSGWPGPVRGSVSIRGAKLFLDGAFGARTCAIEGVFPDGTSGMLTMEPGRLAELVEASWEAGLEPMLHAIGARALAMASSLPVPPGRSMRIEHAEQLEPVWPGTWTPGAHRFSMQPNFVRRWQGPGGLYESLLPAGQARRLNPFGLVERAGFDLGFGSDGMPFGPLYGLQGATAHTSPDLSLDRAAALRAYTYGSSAISGLEPGSPGPGGLADLVLLDGDPMRTPWDELAVVATLSGGETAWEAPGWEGVTG